MLFFLKEEVKIFCRSNRVNILKKVIGPHSKYDKSLPYTYMARVAAVKEIEELYSYYFADTICGLIEYLDKHQIPQEDVELFGLYQRQEIPLEKEYCLNKQKKWLDRPDICHSLEMHYKETLEDRYKGHVAKEPCLFDDRNRKGRGTGVY
jgi:hypothetical protein